MDGRQDTTGVAIELVLSLCIANSLDGVAGNSLQVDINLAAHLAHDNYLACRYKTFAGYACVVVVGQKLV